MMDQLKVMLRCDICGTLNDTTEITCTTCGTKLSLHGKSVLVNEANGIVDGHKTEAEPLPDDSHISPQPTPPRPQPAPPRPQPAPPRPQPAPPRPQPAPPRPQPAPPRPQPQNPFHMTPPTGPDTYDKKSKNPLMGLCSLLFGQCAVSLLIMMYVIASYCELIPTDISELSNLPFFAAAVAIYIALMFISLVKVFTVRQKTISLIICTIFSILMLIGVITASISSIDFLF